MQNSCEKPPTQLPLALKIILNLLIFNILWKIYNNQFIFRFKEFKEFSSFIFLEF